MREHDNIYFKVKDVSEQFEIPRLQKTLIDKQVQYTSGLHYTYFNCNNSHTMANNSSKIKKELFLSYIGILKVLFSSRTGNVNNFVKWATETLFTAQLGTTKQKAKIASNLLGVPVSDFNNMMLKPNTKVNIASIYFITFGTAKDLRESMNLDESILDDDVISIYGYTDNLRRRLVEHKNKYKSIKGANLALKYYSFVDKTQLSKAEKDIKEYFLSTNAHLEYDTEKEMVCTDANTLKYLEAQYQTIGKKYEGDNTEIIQKMKDMEMAHKHELVLKDHELEIKNTEIKLIIANHEKELALKEVEVLQWKLKFMEKIKFYYLFTL